MNNETAIVPRAGDGMTQTFGGQSIERAHETQSSAMAAHAKATIEARHIMALRFPRDMDTVRRRLLKECQRPSFAACAIYHKPIGKGVEGLSIRFAEAAARAMTNINCESFVVYDDEQKRIVQVQVTDLEANLPWSKGVVIGKTVERNKLADGQRALGRRKNSKGYDVFIVEATDDDILNKQNAIESKAFRTGILRVLPGDLQDECIQAIRATQLDADAADPDAARRVLADSFDAMGVSPIDLAAYLGHDLGKSTPAELGELRAVWSALNDGEATWPEALAHKRAQRGEIEGDQAKQAKSTSGSKAIMEKMRARKQAAKPAAPAAAPATPAPAAKASKPEPKPAKGAKAQPTASAPAKEPEPPPPQKEPEPEPAGEEQAPAAADGEAEDAVDEYQAELDSLAKGIAVAVNRPNLIPGLRARIARLPPGDDREELEALLAAAKNGQAPS